MTHGTARTLRVGALARVEGEGGMLVRVRDGRVGEVRLEIYEPPRFFEAFLRGRARTEAPDITARICGICPVAYQMSACRAIEQISGVGVTPEIQALRRLLYCGEWIESHALHIYLLHAPDFLGYPGAVEMARDHREIVERGLRIKKAGNEVMEVVGGRAIHPVNVRIGGFYRAPAASDLAALRAPLRAARDDALDTVRWVSRFAFPDFEGDYEFVSASEPGAYPIFGERIISSEGLDIPVADFEKHFVEEQVAHSNALHSRRRGGGTYLVGPLARYSLNAAALSPGAREAAAEAGLGTECRNPFRSIVVRAVELLHACDEALALIDAYRAPEPPAVGVPARQGSGTGCTEAPRGILYHRYEVAADGSITEAKIVPPTSQNQAQIEADLRRFVEPRLAMPVPELTYLCEQAIRNYDPCISCATHFLDLRVVPS